jgi:BlaI family transcriptional regulator, penicillinase repressor
MSFFFQVKITMANPTPSELEILQILWSQGESKVQAINDKLCETKPVGYTTTLKIMQIMTEKGLLGRKKDGKSHIYYPLIQKGDTQTSLLEKFIATAFGGSRSKLVMQLLGNKDISKKELEDIKQFLNEMENKND